MSVRLRRLVACLVTGLVAALVTGPDGTENHLVLGIKGSLLHPRVFAFLGFGLAIWLLFEGNERYGLAVRATLRRAGAGPRHLLRVRPARYTVYAAVLAFAIAFPPTLSSYWQTVLVNEVGIYVLLALGLNVVVGFAGLLDLGYIAFFAIGAYTDAYFTGILPAHPPFHLNPFWVLPFAVLAAIFAGVVLGSPTLRLRGDYLAIVTLGFGEIIQRVAANLQSVTNGATGAIGIPHFAINLVGIHYTWTLSNLPYYYLLLGFVVIILAAFRLLENSRVGRAWTAIREDEVAAAATGINTFKYKILAFAIGASTSGFAGVLFASKISSFDPNTFPVADSILVLVMVLFGGLGSLSGPVVGAAALWLVPEWLRGRIKPTDLFIYFGALLVVMMIFRPQGLSPSRRRAREIGLAERGIGGADAVGVTGGTQ